MPWPDTFSMVLFLAVVVAVAAGLAWAVVHVRPEPRDRARWLGALLLWIVGTGAYAALWLDEASPFVAVFPLVVANFGAVAWVGLSPMGRDLAVLPLPLLVGAHAFRLPLEWVLHLWAEQGVVPAAMSWGGENFDDVDGGGTRALEARGSDSPGREGNPKKSSGLLRQGEPVTAYRFIRSEEANHAVRLMCRVLRVSRAAYYAWRNGRIRQRPASDAKLLVHIKAIHRRHKGRYGAPRITVELRDQGFVVNRKRVARVMREHGIVGRPRRVFRGTTTDSDHDAPVAPDLLQRQFEVDAPNRAFVGDITYLPTRQGWVYLAVLIDLFSRKVVGWAMADTLHTSLCLHALERACATRGDVAGAIH